MIECWCISIIFGNDLLVKLDNWFNKPFLGNTVSGLRRGREKGGLLEKFSSCNECLTLQDTDTSAASSNVPHALCKVRQDYRVQVITQPTATLHKLFVQEIFIVAASGQVSNCLDMTIYRIVALWALCDSEKDKVVHFVSTLLCLCLMWPLLWSERDTEHQSTHGPGQLSPDNFSPRHVGVKCASGRALPGSARESVSLAEVRSPLTPAHAIWGHPGHQVSAARSRGFLLRRWFRLVIKTKQG